MQNGKLVIIGGDAAGMSAASKVRRLQPDREIVVFEKGQFTSYAACGMPYYIAGMVKSYEDLIARKPEVFRKKQNIDVRTRHEVIRIDPKNKRVQVKDLEKEELFWEPWDSLLIATGASPVIPDLPCIRATGVFALSGLQSGIDVFQFLKEENPRRAVIAGGGYIGIEMAEALLARGLEVSIIDMAAQLMATLDPDMAALVADYMRKAGVKVYLEEKLEKLEADSRGKVKMVVTAGHKIDAELVILGLGIRPNSVMAKEAGLKLGANDAIRVNKRMQTSAEGIWAGGDCATSFHLLKNFETHIALGTVANKHGLVAGINMGGGCAKFPGVLGTAITRFKKLEVARTGLSEKELQEIDIKYKAETIDSLTRSGYFPGTEKMTVKLLAEKGSGRLLGGQIVGLNGSAKRIDTLVAALTSGMTAQQLMDLDLSYAPPFSPVWDPMQIAARRLT